VSAQAPKAKGPSRAWWIAFAIVFLSTLTFFQLLTNTNNQLQDTDTIKILAGINARHDPTSWFKGDWPLANHFYRPIVSLIFELDNALHSGSTIGFALTDVLLCSFATLALFWFLRELLDSPLMATAGTLLFIIWQWDAGIRLDNPCFWVGVLCLFGGFYRHSLKIAYYIPAILVWLWLGHELSGITDLTFRMLLWIPGRTASTMTVFGLVSMAAFARYLRLSPPRDTGTKPATALDRPATKSSIQTSNKPASIGWPLLSIAALLISLGAYEQAVMVPALLGLIAVYFHILGRKVEWGWGWAFAACLGGYLVLRQSVISHQPSAYWNWQKRTTTTALIMLQRYFFLPYRDLLQIWDYTSDGALIWTTSGPWYAILGASMGFSALWESRRRWLLCGFGWVGSTLAYGPMAWFKDFDHYHYWPMAIRTIFVLGLAGVAIDLTVIALSRPGLQAPRRLSPAPGSLLHP
jgi:hypothetical protein